LNVTLDTKLVISGNVLQSIKQEI